MYGLAAWKRWVTIKNAELAGVSSSRNMKLMSDDLLSMNCEELNYALCLFLKDLTKPNGESYQPDSVFYLLLGKYFFDIPRLAKTRNNEKDFVKIRLIDYIKQIMYLKLTVHFLYIILKFPVFYRYSTTSF